MGALTLLHRNSTGSAIKQFAKRFELVYFGRVDHRYDEHAVIRGLTASASHTDHHFAVGNVQGRDISVLERQNTLRFPGKGERAYSWLIVQIDLDHRVDLPHVFLDGHHHDELFYANLFIKFANLQVATSLFGSHDGKFMNEFLPYAPSDQFDDVTAVLTPAITAMLAHHFKQFDYEFDGAAIYVYDNQPANPARSLEDMVRVGLWLADALEGQFLPADPIEEK